MQSLQRSILTYRFLRRLDETFALRIPISALRILAGTFARGRNDLKRHAVDPAPSGVEDFDLYSVVRQCFADVRDSAELMKHEAADRVEMFVVREVQAKPLIDFANVNAGQCFAGALAG